MIELSGVLADIDEAKKTLGRYTSFHDCSLTPSEHRELEEKVAAGKAKPREIKLLKNFESNKCGGHYYASLYIYSKVLLRRCKRYKIFSKKKLSNIQGLLSKVKKQKIRYNRAEIYKLNRKPTVQSLEKLTFNLMEDIRTEVKIRLGSDTNS